MASVAGRPVSLLLIAFTRLLGLTWQAERDHQRHRHCQRATVNCGSLRPRFVDGDQDYWGRKLQQSLAVALRCIADDASCRAVQMHFTSMQIR